MDHKEALRLQAAEKYLLGELPQELRDVYEEHYFECAECALDVKAGAAFVDNSREVLRTEEKAAERDAAPAFGGWFGWLRPALAVPVFAALLLMIGYQNLVTIPKVKEGAARGSGQVFTASITLSPQIANVSRGEEVEEAKVQVPRNESFALKFDFTPSARFDSYICQLQDEAGRTLLQESIPSSSENREVNLVVPGGLVRPGKYSLVFNGAPTSEGKPARDEVLRFRFAIEFLP
jgi:hypothetical protein